MRLPVEILRLGHIRYTHLKVPRVHRHDFFHVLFVLHGRGYVQVNGSTHEVNPGDVHLYHPSWSHDIWSRPHSTLEVLDLRFLVLGAPEREGIADMPALVTEETYPILELMRRIERTGRARRGRLWQDLAHSYLIQLLASVLNREPATPVLRLPDRQEETVAAALQIMHQSLPLGLSVSTLAERLCMSPTHLANVFKRAVGESPSSYMTRLKLDDCMRAMVMEWGVPIYRLRRRYGWSDEGHFRRLFKRYLGYTPREVIASGPRVARSARTVEHWVVFNECYPMRWYDTVSGAERL